MGRRNEHSREELQEMAISAAEAIIASEGLRGLTARKVAGQLGYSAGSLYMVFNGLDELILHVNARTLGRLADNLDAHTMTDATPLAALRALAHGYLRFAMQEQTRWRAVFDHQLSKETKLPCWYTDTVDALMDRVRKPVNALLPNATRAELTLKTTALWSAVHGVCELNVGRKLDVGGVNDPSRVLDSLLDDLVKTWTLETEQRA